MPIQLLKYPHAKFSFQINWALTLMKEPLLKISLSEKERKNYGKQKPTSLTRIACLRRKIK
jgi:hypothetical protein